MPQLRAVARVAAPVRRDHAVDDGAVPGANVDWAALDAEPGAAEGAIWVWTCIVLLGVVGLTRPVLTPAV